MSASARPLCIAWIPNSLTPWLSELQLDSAIHATQNERGLFLQGRLPHRRGPSSLLPPRLFLLSEHRVWVESGARPSNIGDELRARDPGSEDIVLVTRSGECLRMCAPQSWPALDATILEPSEFMPDTSPDTSPGVANWTLRLDRDPEPRRWTRDGILCTPGAGAEIAEYLLCQPGSHLRDLRRGEARGFWWLYSPRGITPEMPRAGRSLVNLGSTLAPLLVPAGQKPRPLLDANQIRSVFEVPEGDGLLWWNSSRGEEYCIFRRSDLRTLTRDIVQAETW